MSNLILYPYFSTELNNKILLTNDIGEHLWIEKEELAFLAENPEKCSENTIIGLKSRFFACEKESKPFTDEIRSVRFKTKHSYLENDMLLLMVVPTISCNCNCIYCQVTSKKDRCADNDMSIKTAAAFCDFVFAMPHKNIKIEFQGGEPTIRFDIVEFIIRRLYFLNKRFHKSLEYVICTNLISLQKSQLNVLKKYNVAISSSLDGPQSIHDKCRPAQDGLSSYREFERNVALCRKRELYPSALVTVTSYNIKSLREVVDTYVSNGFENIFIRPLNDYGYAFNNRQISYSVDEYVAAYEEAVRYIIELNVSGRARMREEWFSILLRKILLPFNDGFVDMQNPCALGQMSLIVRQNGDVFPSDEARMIAEMGDFYWKMGNVMNNDCLVSMAEKRRYILETGDIKDYTECRECAYSPFCYADPIKKWYIDKYSGADYCGARKRIFDFVFKSLYNANGKMLALFRSWANV